jgi:hypothetical protein
MFYLLELIFSRPFRQFYGWPVCKLTPYYISAMFGAAFLLIHHLKKILITVEDGIKDFKHGYLLVMRVSRGGVFTSI